MGLRRGAEFLESLRDGREVWLEGEKVPDVTSHPSLAGCAAAIADLYDLQHDPGYRDLLTTESPSTGDRVSLAYQLPSTVEDLQRHRAMIEFLMRGCGGVAARLPEYMALILTGVYDVRGNLAEADPAFFENIARFFQYCRENDLALTQSFTTPSRDQSRPATDFETFHVVEDRPDGIVVRGAKAVATNAPYANDFLSLNGPRPGYRPEEIAYFAVPLATEGIRVICRPSVAHPATPDHVLSSSFDEMDATVIFNDVFVPRERVFFLRRVDVHDTIARDVFQWSNWHVLIRLAVKAEVLAGICVGVADYLGTTKQTHVQAALSDVLTYMEILRGFVLRAEADSGPSRSGLAAPNTMQVDLGLLYGVENHPRILQVIRELSSSSLLMAPGHANLTNPEIGGDLSRYFIGKDERAVERFKLLKLAWEYSGDSFGSRQLLFEMLNTGNMLVKRNAVAGHYDTREILNLAKGLAGIGEPAQGQAAWRRRSVPGERERLIGAL